MKNNGRSMFVLLTVAGLVLLLFLPALASADGGPILTDPELWAMIDEGQQIAVVQLHQDGTAQVDLFISMADRSGQSHEVTFFLPLGVRASAFGVVEETSLAFDEALTNRIEAKLKAGMRSEALYHSSVQASLLLGSLVANGVWLVAVPLMLSSCAGDVQAPVATFETPSSQVAIYDMNTETDLQALIETTGLDPKVRETLAALQGQQIAVVKLRTQPVNLAEEASHDSWESAGQPGIHLSWRSTLVSHSAEATYTYPLGTGKAWASPIELTRVYVVSPPELDFRVEYPRLGDDLSGMRETMYGGLVQQVYWRIDDAEDPAFAVDEVYGEFGHIWRATYIKSNSAQDVVVTSLPELSLEMRRAIRHNRVRGVITQLTWFIAPLAGLAVWVTSWRTVMRRRLGVPYRWLQGKLYRDALLWTGVYVLMSLIALLTFGCTLFALYDYSLYVIGPALPLMLILSGPPNAWIFSRWKAEKLQVTHGRAFGAYMLAVLMANILYLAFAAAYYAIVCAI